MSKLKVIIAPASQVVLGFTEKCSSQHMGQSQHSVNTLYAMCRFLSIFGGRCVFAISQARKWRLRGATSCLPESMKVAELEPRRGLLFP